MIDFWWTIFGEEQYKLTETTATSAAEIGNYVNLYSVYSIKFDDNSIVVEKNRESFGYAYTEEAIRYEAKKMKEAGLKVNLLNTVWQEVDFAEYNKKRSDEWWDAYFAALRDYLTGMAHIADDLDLNMMQVGFGSDSFIGFIRYGEDVMPEDAVQRWLDIIKEVRTIYDGKLIYTCVLSGDVDSEFYTEYMLVPILNEVDYIGISSWRGVTKNEDATFEELNHNFEQYFDNYLKPLYEKYQKPILFIPNYPSAKGGLTGKYLWDSDTVSQWKPSDGTFNDYQAQADAMEAIMRATAERPWIIGVMPWGYWRIELHDKSGNIRGKPSEDVLSEWRSLI